LLRVGCARPAHASKNNEEVVGGARPLLHASEEQRGGSWRRLCERKERDRGVAGGACASASEN
jgi:hypothetical protein